MRLNMMHRSRCENAVNGCLDSETVFIILLERMINVSTIQVVITLRGHQSVGVRTLFVLTLWECRAKMINENAMVPKMALRIHAGLKES